MPANGKPNGRFTLPALTPVSFSLTEGTDIPPPPDSPTEEALTPTPAYPAAKARQPTESSSSHVNGNGKVSAAKGIYDGRGRTITTISGDNPPISPASTRRPISIRRFLSLKSLNANYAGGTSQDHASLRDILAIGRPDSPSSFWSGRPSLGTTRSGSWFSKLGGGGKRTSIVYNKAPPDKEEVRQENMGPPPPILPELNQLKAKIYTDDEGSLGGGEMFRSIKGE